LKEKQMSSTDVLTTTTATRRADHSSQGRGWAYAGVAAGVASIVSIVASGMAGAVYDEKLAGDADGIVDKMADQVATILVMHTGAMISALLLLVFAAGLRRRLLESTPEGSLLPSIAASGLMLVSVAQLMGSGLTTEFAFGLAEPEKMVPETAVFFGHWIGTIPWLWVGAGVTALALAVAGRSHGAVARWLTWTSFALGTITVLFGISPLQYMAGMFGPVWLTVAALGLLKKQN
jgi:hypothetical protein